MTDQTANYYDHLTPYYHLIYEDWEQQSRGQAALLDQVIQEHWPGSTTLLDAACGIGTQSIGLAERGYTVVGSDISQHAVERARREAAGCGLTIEFRQADMRNVAQAWAQQFDIVIACDNAIPHLLSPEAILAALNHFYQCTQVGGGCIVSVRDYKVMDVGGTQLIPRKVHQIDHHRVVLFDVWDFAGEQYTISTYIIEDDGIQPKVTCVRGGIYSCITTDRLEGLMRAAGYTGVTTLHDRFYQPLLIGTRQ